MRVLHVVMMLLNGINNGDIALTRDVLEKRGIRGERQRTQAIAELLAAGWLKRTKRGGLRMGPDLFAITVRPVNECIDKRTGKSRHDAKPESVASHLWRKENAHLREDAHVRKRSDRHPEAKRRGTTTTLRLSAGLHAG
jgi:hypothetical protein